MINVFGRINQGKPGKEPWLIRQTNGPKSIYTVAMGVAQVTTTVSSTNASVLSIFHPATYGKKFVLQAVTVSWGAGSGGTFGLALAHITSDSTGGLNVIAKHDQRDPASGMSVRGAPTFVAPDVIYARLELFGTSSGQFTFDFRQPNEGKPIILNPFVGEGIQIATTVVATMTTQAQVMATATWVEE